MPSVVHVSNCCYSVKAPQEFEILRVSVFSVQDGEPCVIFGPSGSGKTTLFNILAGLLSPTQGEVEVAGFRLESMSESERDRFRGQHIGFVFQSFNLLQGLSALENVLIGMTLSGTQVDSERAKWLLGEVGLSDRFHHRPYQLSIGEQQRVAVARALAHKPTLLLADEPTGSLDPKRALEILDLILSLAAKQNCTVLLISHDPAVVGRFPRKVAIGELNQAFTKKTNLEGNV